MMFVGFENDNRYHFKNFTSRFRPCQDLKSNRKTLKCMELNLLNQLKWCGWRDF